MPSEIEVPMEEIQEQVLELHEEHEHPSRHTAEEVGEGTGGNSHKHWTHYIAFSTAILAVTAAVGSLQAGKFINEAILEKNEQVANLTKASDQWGYYQAKGIKSLIIRSSDPKASERYAREQEQIKVEAEGREKEAEHASHTAEVYLERHEKFAISVSLCQIAIALSAIAAITRRKNIWLMSLLTGAISLLLLAYGYAGYAHPLTGP